MAFVQDAAGFAAVCAVGGAAIVLGGLLSARGVGSGVVMALGGAGFVAWFALHFVAKN